MYGLVSGGESEGEQRVDCLLVFSEENMLIRLNEVAGVGSPQLDQTRCLFRKCLIFAVSRL